MGKHKKSDWLKFLRNTASNPAKRNVEQKFIIQSRIRVPKHGFRGLYIMQLTMVESPEVASRMVHNLELAFKGIQSRLSQAEQDSVNKALGHFKACLEQHNLLSNGRGSHVAANARCSDSPQTCLDGIRLGDH